jgi:hypothetical protein
MRCFAKVLTLSWCAFFASLLGAPTTSAADTKPASASQETATERYGDLPLSFEANHGQTDGQVRFLSRGSGYSFFLTQSGAVLSFSSEANSDSVLRMQLAGASSSARIEGVDQLPGRSNYFAGSDPTQWRTEVPTYSRVKYNNIYPGISLIYYGNQRQLEYDFVVSPCADPRQIHLAIAGAQKMVVDAQGNLVLRNSAGEVQLLAPRVYQQINGRKKNISGQWTLAANSTASFHLGKYDRTQPLVIDPVLMYSSFLGGSQKNAVRKIAIDAAGNAYVAGYTASGDFPAAPTPLATTFGAGPQSRGAFVAKIDSTGSNLLYSTYLSGSADEEATGLAIDKSGNVYVAGNTHSTDFPTRNALQPRCATANPSGTCSSAFLTKISPTGDSILFSTYLGGSGAESARGLVVDAKGSAYLAGVTSSSDFPVTAGAAQARCGGACQQNAFVAKFSPSGDKLAYATYVGGSALDDAADLAVDSTGNAYLTGHTTSPDFPLATPYQKSCAADAASASKTCIATAFVTKITPDGSSFSYSTYLGGSLGSKATAIAVEAQGSAYVTGSTQSPDFPVAKPFQKSCGRDAASGKCSIDAFLTKFAPTGKALVYSTYLGGAGRDEASGIAVDATGSAHLIGRTESADFPTAKPLQAHLKGSSDAFAARFDPTGSALTFSTYHGGTATESGNSLALDTQGNLYLAGETTSADFPTQHPFQSSCAGACTSAFVTKMALPPANSAPTITSAASTTFTVGTAGTFTVTTTGTPTPAIDDGSATLPGAVTFLDNGDGTATLAGTPAAGSGGTYTFTITAANGTPPNDTQSFTLTVNEAPTITSANATTFTEGVAGTFTVTATGFPKPALSQTGTRPTGVNFTPATGKLAGTPANGTAASSPYALTFTAHNTSGPDSVQAFTLNVKPAPVLSVVKAHTGAFTQGGTGTWTVDVSNTAVGSTTTSGLNVTDTLPTGYKLASDSGTNWSCTGVGSASVSCTSTSTVPGGAAYPTLSLTVSIPNSSPNTVSNTASASGGGAFASASGSDNNVPVGQVPANLVTTSGGGQSTPINNNFPSAFSATVTDAASNPIQGVPVTFTALSGPGNATCFFAGSSTTTVNSDASGVATTVIPCKANSAAAGYNVQASVTTAGVPKPNFAVNNTDFSLAFAPASANVAPGAAPAGVTVTATAVNGYAPASLTVTSCLTTTGPAPQPTCSITSPITVGTGATVTFSTAGSPASTYTVQATVHDSSAVPVTHTATFTLHVVQVTISTVPPATVEVGQTLPFAGSTVGIGNANVNWSTVGSGCTGTVCGTFSAPGPNTSTNYLSPATTSAGLSVSIQAASSVDSNFTDSKGPISITDYSVALPGATLVIPQTNPGAAGASTLSATATNAYAGTITATPCTVLPGSSTLGPVPTCSVTAPAVPGSSPVAISTQANTPTGLYSMSVTATDNAGTPQVRSTNSQPFAINCGFSLGSAASFLPVFNPATTTNTTNSFSFGVTETAGGSNCAWGNKPIIGPTIPAASVDGVVVLGTDTNGGVITAVNGFTQVTLSVAAPGEAAQSGTLTVPFFDPAGTANTSNLILPVGLEAATPITAVQGGTIAPFPVAITQAAAGTLTIPNINLTGVTSACGAVKSAGADPNNLNYGITCSATVSGSNLQLSVTLPAAKSASIKHDRSTPAMLFALTLGFPAIVFLSVGASAFAPRKRKRGWNRITCTLGILLLLSLLVVVPACGGGFQANFTPQNTNTYTLTVMGYVTDGSNNVVGLDVFTVLLTVN